MEKLAVTFRLFVLAGLILFPVAILANAQEANTDSAPSAEAPPTPDGEDETKILDEVEINKSNRRKRREPTTGTLKIEPLPVKMAGSPRIFEHAGVELILRPVRPGADNIYEADNLEGVDFRAIAVELGIGKKVVGSRLPLAKHGKRSVTMPEGVYAITEIRYLVFNQIGRVFDPDDPFGNPTPIPRRDYSFCLSGRTIAFDIKNGQTTDVGRLIIRALESRFTSSKREHRPFLGADAAFSDISDPSLRNKAPELASAGIIEFKNEAPLCRESARPTMGWFTAEELEESLPSFSERLNKENQDS